MFYYPATPLLFIAFQLLFMDIPDYWKHTKANAIPATVKLQQVFYEYAIHGDKVIDIGCACGDVCDQLASAGFYVMGVDVNPEALKQGILSSKENEPIGNPFFLQADAAVLPFTNDIFDIAIMQAFLTTITTKEERNIIIREACRILKPGGYLYLADFGQTWHSKIYRERYINDLPLTKEEGSIIAYDKRTGEKAYISHHFTEKELVFLLVENGFEIEFFRNEEFTTRTGNRVNGFVVVGRKGKMI
ncbi:class I SAM-dependent methyltransferase [Methanomethylovorans sp.]|uniref:class I SAM-dependent methyltransferase n=1 Tax=Methanomethylovorans sp. TaxID=2758717 RepID=UPI00351C5498